MVAKRKLTASAPNKKTGPSSSKSRSMFDWNAAKKEEETIDSSSGEDAGNDEDEEVGSDTEAMQAQMESATDKRIRLAKEYLAKVAASTMQDDTDDDSDDEDETASDKEDRVGSFLATEQAKASGKLFTPLAASFLEFDFTSESSHFTKCHRLSVTALTVMTDPSSPSQLMAYSGSKDGSLYQWNLTAGTKTKVAVLAADTPDERKNNVKGITALATNSEGSYLASGSVDAILRLYAITPATSTDPVLTTCQESFTGHRDSISSLAFRQYSHSLFSGSADRTIKHWNTKDLGYIETLFGHQAPVMAIAAGRAERLISVGADRTLRVWKIPEETQLVFHNAPGVSLDCVALVNAQYYVSGGDDGALTLWFNGRKKPAAVIPAAHGAGNWIASVAMCPDTDLLASGSCDGLIRLWQVDLAARTLRPVATIPAMGFVNALAFAPDQSCLVAGLGQEHRLGRWHREAKAKNGLLVTALPQL